MRWSKSHIISLLLKNERLYTAATPTPYSTPDSLPCLQSAHRRVCAGGGIPARHTRWGGGSYTSLYLDWAVSKIFAMNGSPLQSIHRRVCVQGGGGHEG